MASCGAARASMPGGFCVRMALAPFALGEDSEADPKAESRDDPRDDIGGRANEDPEDEL